MCNYTRRHQPPVHDRFSLLISRQRIAAIDACGQSLTAELNISACPTMLVFVRFW